MDAIDYKRLEGMILQRHSWLVCRRKVGYPTLEAAFNVVEKVDSTLHPYRCFYCGLYHNGHISKGMFQ